MLWKYLNLSSHFIRPATRPSTLHFDSDPVASVVEAMNPFALIRRKAKSANQAEGHRSRKITPIKRKIAGSEPECSYRPNKSPRISSMSNVVTDLSAKTLQDPEVDATGSDHSRGQFSGTEGRLDVASHDTLELDAQKAEADQQVEGLALDQEQQQELREDCYLEFSGESVDDYTYGPVRIVNCSDGVSTCASLLLRLDFCAKVRAALEAQREYMKMERKAPLEETVAMEFEEKIEIEISSHQERLRKPEREQGANAEPDKQRSLKQEVHVLKQMLEKRRSNQRQAKTSLESRAVRLRRLQIQVNAYLEDAFVCANLVEPESGQPDTPIENLDLQEEYKKFCQNLETQSSEKDIVPLDTSRDYPRPPTPSPEEQARRDAVNAWWAAHDRVRLAEEFFDTKHIARDRAWLAFAEAIARGERSESDIGQEFDLPWLQYFNERTRELREAQEVFAIEQANVLKVGIELGSQDELSYLEKEQTGNHEGQIIPVARNPRVASWLKSVSSVVSPTECASAKDMDDYELQDVAVAESLSVIAEGTVRKRINEWQAKMGEERLFGRRVP